MDNDNSIKIIMIKIQVFILQIVKAKINKMMLKDEDDYGPKPWIFFHLNLFFSHLPFVTRSEISQNDYPLIYTYNPRLINV